VRLFVAINLSPEIRRGVLDATEPLRERAPELSWVDEARLHLTLKFLGEQPDERLGEIKDVLASVAGRHRELVMDIGGVGAFPNFRRARVVWIGIAQEPRLELLHHDVEVACESIGFEVEGRPFRPHLTLARVKTPISDERARELSRLAKRTDYRGDFIVRSVDLMRSELSAKGSSYTTLVSAALRSG
jgi:2'-5' RNA ligase